MQIINAIPYGGEIEMLEGRLHTYAHEVDKFVLLESDRMFANQPKPYYFEEHADRFKDFHDKIIYEKIKGLGDPSAYKNDAHQRSSLKGIVEKLGLQSNDIVVVSDTDEWYPPNRINKIVHTTTFDMNKMHMSLHWFHKIETVAVAGVWGHLKNLDFHEAHGNRGWNVMQGGWHLTSMGDADYLIKKVRGFAHHHELVYDGVDDELRECWTWGKDLRGVVFKEIELKQAFYPAWIMEHKFPEIWYRRRPKQN